MFIRICLNRYVPIKSHCSCLFRIALSHYVLIKISDYFIWSVFFNKCFAGFFCKSVVLGQYFPNDFYQSQYFFAIIAKESIFNCNILIALEFSLHIPASYCKAQHVIFSCSISYVREDYLKIRDINQDFFDVHIHICFFVKPEKECYYEICPVHFSDSKPEVIRNKNRHQYLN